MGDVLEKCGGVPCSVCVFSEVVGHVLVEWPKTGTSAASLCNPSIANPDVERKNGLQGLR